MIFGRLLCFKPFFSRTSSSTTKRTGKTKPHCCRQKYSVLNHDDEFDGEDVFERLPDDVTIDILSRLPADFVVLSCRRVCKRWWELTLLRPFAEKHLEKSLVNSPGVGIASFSCSSTNKFSLYLFRKDINVVTTNEGKAVTVTKVSCDLTETLGDAIPFVIGSCNGLLAVMPISFNIHDTIKFMICNPVTQEHVILPRPPMTTLSPFRKRITWSCFFYNPLAKQYKLLFSFIHSPKPEYHDRIFIYELKKRGGGGGGEWRELGVMPYTPTTGSNHAVQNNTLHWMAWSFNELDEKKMPHCRSSILTFNMTSEEFGSMPHPGDRCASSGQCHKDMVLLDMEGKVAVCRHAGILVDLWVLEDYDNWLWSKSYQVNLNHVSMCCGPLPYYNGLPNRHAAMPMRFGDGGEVLYMKGSYGGLCRYHLKKKTAEKIGAPMMNPPAVTVGLGAPQYYSVSYTPSFVSLANLG